MTKTQSSPLWPRPLAGVRVLDFTRVLAGDETHAFPPIRDGESHYFLAVNRARKSVVIDLKTPEGVALVKGLAAKSDVVIENYRPEVMDRLGPGWETLPALNSRLIYCAISGFGMTGPLRDRPSSASRWAI